MILDRDPMASWLHRWPAGPQHASSPNVASGTIGDPGGSGCRGAGRRGAGPELARHGKRGDHELSAGQTAGHGYAPCGCVAPAAAGCTAGRRRSVASARAAAPVGRAMTYPKVRVAWANVHPAIPLRPIAAARAEQVDRRRAWWRGPLRAAAPGGPHVPLDTAACAPSHGTGT